MSNGRLELPSGELRPVGDERVDKVFTLGEKLRVIGSGFDSVPASVQQELNIRLHTLIHGESLFANLIDTTALARSFLASFRADQEIRNQIPFSVEVVRSLTQLLSSRPGPLVTVYLELYDQLEGRQELGQFLLDHYQNLDETRRLSPSDLRFRNFASLLFIDGAPRKFAEYATTHQWEIAKLSQDAGVPGLGDFHDTVWKWFYVTHSKEAPYGTISNTLNEALQSRLYEQPLEGRKVGHLLVEVLSRRCIQDSRSIPDRWLSYILRIAGDPRKSATSLQFQSWWAPQEADVIKKVKASLAKRDLEFFLQLLEEFSVQQGGDMERMFPARKRFLEGILAEGDGVQDALLILSKSGQRYIRDKLPIEDRRGFSSSVLLRGNNPEQSAIYLELPNGHLIEGSHQSQLRIYQADSPFACRLRDTRPQSVGYKSITGSETRFNKTHHPPVGWQYGVMKHLANADYGMRLDPQKALSPEDYRLMLKKYGAI